jgi:K+-sensing histidine kinase KdpD
VQAHHGEVNAGNAPAGGAVFRVSLPIEDTVPSTAPATGRAPRSGTAAVST